MPNKCSQHGGHFTLGSISTGTLRTQDILRTFADEYERLMPFNGKRLADEARETAGALDLDPDGDKFEHWDAAIALEEELHDALGQVAHMHGATFGALEGDGADFGFWAVEDEEA